MTTATISSTRVSVGEITDQLRGVSYGKSDASPTPQDGYVPILRAGNISDGVITFDDLVYVPKRCVKDSQLLKEHDILIAASSGSISVVGKAARCERDWHGSFGAFCKVLRPKPCVDGRYLGHFFQTPSYRKIISNLAAGVNINNLRNEHFDNLEIPLPPLPEQKRIADILDKADAIRRKRAQALELTDKFLQSVFLDMFGDPVTNPKGWEDTTIGELAPDKGLIVDGPFGSSLKPECYVPEGVRVIRNFNIKDDCFDGSAFKFVTEEKFDEISRSQVIAGDILLSTKGTIGNVCEMPDLPGKSVLSASGTVRLRIPMDSKVTPEFLMSQMAHPSYKRHLCSFEAGSIQKYLNLSGIRKMKVIAPPKDLQESFARLRQTRLRMLASLHDARTLSGGLFESIVQRAFRGEL